MKPLPFSLRHLSILAAFIALTWVAWAEDSGSKVQPASSATMTVDQTAAPAPDSAATADLATSPAAPSPAEAPTVAEPTAAPTAPIPAAVVEAAPAPKAEQPEAVEATSSTTPTEAPAVKVDSDTKSDDKPVAKDEKPAKKKKHFLQSGPKAFHSQADAPSFGNHTVIAGEKRNEIVSIFGNTSVEGEVESDAVAVFGNNNVSGKVGSDAVAVFGENKISGKVGGDAVAVFGNLTVNGEVNGDAVAVFGNMALGPKAKVNGECVNVFGHVTRDPLAEVGNIQEVMSFAMLGSLGSWLQNCILRGRLLWFGPGLSWAWIFAGAHLLFYFFLALILRKPTERCVDTLVERPGMSIFAALLGIILPPLVIVLLAITGIGAVLIPFFVIFLFGASFFGRTVMHAWIGRPITRLFGPGPFSHIAFAVLVGGIVISLLYCVPVVAFMVHALLGIIGFGVVILAIFTSIKREKKSTPAAPAAVPPVPTPAVPAPAAPMAVAPMVSPIAPLPSDAAFPPAAPLGQPPVSPAGFAFEPAAQPPVVQPISAAAPRYLPLAAAPAPSTTAAPVVASSLPRASFWIRMGALLIDVILVCLLMKCINTVLPSRIEIHFGPGLFFFMALYGALMWKLRGTTIGGIICKLQIVRTDDRPLDWATCIVRSLGCVLSAFVVGLGFIWIAIDDNRESWHDKIAGSAVVRLPASKPLV
ncbi:MAG: RDD family protein [Opitutaceae bacterium]|jgi:uncharacterized RDD family membrane protein YckC